MSIVTLKKLTAAKYNNSSCGMPVFSINGTHRSQGYVGQDTRGRTILKTPMKGDVIRGNGGCCGTYDVKPIAQSCVTSLNDNSVVKSSCVGNTGHIMQRYRWIRRPAPFSVVKPDVNNNINTQSQYIENKTQKEILLANTCANPETKITVCVGRPIGSSHNYNTRKFAEYSVLGDPAKIGALSNSDYIKSRLHDRCIQNDVVFVATSTENTPLPHG